MSNQQPDPDEYMLGAILIPPQLDRFRAITGTADVLLSANFTGWHKHVIMAPDRVFLFPRHTRHVAIVEREAAVYDAVRALPLTVPHLLARYMDESVSPYPFLAVTRLYGTRFGELQSRLSLDQIESFMRSLGATIAEWHNLDSQTLPAILHEPLSGWRDPLLWRDRALDSATCNAAASDFAAGLATWLETRDLAAILDDTPVAKLLGVWQASLRELALMRPVLVHRDLHEDQLLVSEDLSISGVLDWETAGIDHPVLDFDFGQWGAPLFAHIAQFDCLREALWSSYVAKRNIAVPNWSRVHLYYCMSEIRWVYSATAQGEQAPMALGTPEELLRRLLAATNLCQQIG